jgi:hypothetical protein
MTEPLHVAVGPNLDPPALDRRRDPEARNGLEVLDRCQFEPPVRGRRDDGLADGMLGPGLHGRDERQHLGLSESFRGD